MLCNQIWEIIVGYCLAHKHVLVVVFLTCPQCKKIKIKIQMRNSAVTIVF